MTTKQHLHMLGCVKEVFTNKKKSCVVRKHFFVFSSIFCLDYLFWQFFVLNMSTRNNDFVWKECGYILADFEYNDIYCRQHQLWEMTKNIEYTLSTDIHSISLKPYFDIQQLVFRYMIIHVLDVDFLKCEYVHNNITIRCDNYDRIRNITCHPGTNCIETENTVHTK